MVHGLRVVRDSLYETFSSTLSKLQNRNPEAKLSPEKIKVTKGAVALLISGAFAFLSHSISEKSAIEEWSANHWVPQSTWELTLRHRGLEKKPEVEAHARLFRNSPVLFSEDTGVWMTEEGCAIYLGHSPYQNSPELWLCRKPPSQPVWIHLGSGMDAFEQLVHFFQSKPAVVSPPRPAIPIDPKELRY